LGDSPTELCGFSLGGGGGSRFLNIELRHLKFKFSPPHAYIHLSIL